MYLCISRAHLLLCILIWQFQLWGAEQHIMEETSRHLQLNLLHWTTSSYFDTDYSLTGCRLGLEGEGGVEKVEDEKR